MTQVYSLFTAPIVEERLEYSVEQIEALCQKERFKNSTSNTKSNLGGWQSGNINYPDSPFFFLSDIEKMCQEFSTHILKFNKSVTMSNAWININPKHSSNQTHTHPGAVLSGVYYIKTPEKCGNIEFQHPAMDMLERDWSRDCNEYNSVNSHTWWLRPKEGTLYIFPSWIRHMVKPNMSDEERVSISFNVV